MIPAHHPDDACACDDAFNEHDEKGCLSPFCLCKQFVPAVKPAPRREYISGVPFEQVGLGQDTVRCLIDGAILDVGGELRSHLASHQFSRLEEDL